MPIFFKNWNVLGSHRLIGLCRFQVYISMIHHLYIALWAHHPQSHHLLSPYVWPPLPFTTPTSFPLVTITLLSVSMSVCFFFLFVHLLLSVLYPTDEWNHMYILILSFQTYLARKHSPMLNLQNFIILLPLSFCFIFNHSKIYAGKNFKFILWPMYSSGSN